jgi:hypothetical protein
MYRWMARNALDFLLIGVISMNRGWSSTKVTKWHAPPADGTLEGPQMLTVWHGKLR